MKLIFHLLLLSCLCNYAQSSLENVYRLQYLLTAEDEDNLVHRINQLDDPLPSMLTAVVLLSGDYITPEEYKAHIGEGYFVELVQVIRSMNAWLKGLVYVDGGTAAYFRRLSISRIAFRQTAYALMSRIYSRHMMFLIKDQPISARFDEYQQFVSQSITDYSIAPDVVYLSGDDDSDDPNYGEDELVLNLDHDIGIQIAHFSEAIGTLQYTAKRLELSLGIPEDVSPMESLQLTNNLIMTMDCIIRASSNSFDTENYNHLFVQTGGLSLLEDFQNIPIIELATLQQYVAVMINALERGHTTTSDQRFWSQEVAIMFPKTTNFEEVQQVYPRQEDMMEEEYQ